MSKSNKAPTLHPLALEIRMIRVLSQVAKGASWVTDRWGIWALASAQLSELVSVSNASMRE